jgi:hypothetical protein
LATTGEEEERREEKKLQDRRHEATKGRVEEARTLLDQMRHREAELEAEQQAFRVEQAVLRREHRAACVREADGMRHEADRDAERELAESERVLMFEAEKVKAQLEAQVPAYAEQFERRIREDA